MLWHGTPGNKYSMLIPIWSDIHWLLIGYVTKAIYLILFGLFTSYTTAGLFSLLLILILAGSIVPRTKSLLSNSVGMLGCDSVSDYRNSVVSLSGAHSDLINVLGNDALVAVDVNICSGVGNSDIATTGYKPEIDTESDEYSPVCVEESDKACGDSNLPLLPKKQHKNSIYYQSRMFSAVASLEVVASLLAPVLTACYSSTLNTPYPGLLFIVLGITSAVSAALTYVVLHSKMYTVIDI